MKFVVSSTELLSHLQAVGKVISSKNTLPILDNFLFDLQDSGLIITASDLETTLITNLKLENVDGEGKLTVPAKILMDILKEFPEQPLTFEIDLETLAIDIISENGKFSVVGLSADEFPEMPVVQEEQKISVELPAEALEKGIEKTHYATAQDELRPMMNGIYIQLKEDNLTFVASDSHKLVRYRRTDITPGIENAFILPKKPAQMLRAILPKEEGDVAIEFDDRNAFFELSNYRMVCRLTEGNYPNYESVIPADNPNKLVIDRADLSTTLRRVSVFSNQASNLAKLKLTGNQVTVSAQDIDFSISAYERLNCQYEGDEMEIGFKATFLAELLNNLDSTDVSVEMSDPSRAGLIFPVETEEDEDILMLIMPMMIGA